MAINKNAVLRYQTLDKCFSNFGRKYYFDDLLEEVNQSLRNFNPDLKGIKTRQLRDDIRFMKSEDGYDAPIVTHKDGQKAFYRYKDKHFSINNNPLNETEMDQLKSMVSLLKRFEGSPQFDWLNELGPMLSDRFGFKKDEAKVMSFESNIDYTGYEYIGVLFNAISNKRVLNVKYQPFGKDAYQITFHPYYLKQYNHRWFCFGLNQFKEVEAWNIALDRIKDIQEIDESYIMPQIDFEEFFDDMVGVSRDPEANIEEVELMFSPSQAPYIKTKPLHMSQKSYDQEDGSLLVKIKVVINYELEMKLLAFADQVKVLSPNKLKESVLVRLKSAVNKYK